MVHKQIPIINGITRKNISSGSTRNAYFKKRNLRKLDEDGMIIRMGLI